MYFPPHETAVKNHFSPCTLLLSNIRHYWLSLLSTFLLKCQWSLSLSHYIKKEKEMCSSHPPFLFPCWICLTSLHKSYHQLMYIYISLLNWVLSISSLRFHDIPSPAFFPLVLTTPVSHWNLLVPLGHCPRPIFLLTSTPMASITTSMCQLDLSPKGRSHAYE